MKPLPPHPTHYRQMDDSHRVTVFSRDVDGRTALHIAARIGRSHLTRVWRLGLGGVVWAYSETSGDIESARFQQRCPVVN